MYKRMEDLMIFSKNVKSFSKNGKVIKSPYQDIEYKLYIILINKRKIFQKVSESFLHVNVLNISEEKKLEDRDKLNHFQFKTS